MDNFIWEFKSDGTYTKKGNVTHEFTINGKTDQYEYIIDSSGKLIHTTNYNSDSNIDEYNYIRMIPDSDTTEKKPIKYTFGFDSITFIQKYYLGDTTYTETIKGEKVY